MPVLDEEIVEQGLNKEGFFTMRGIKSGVDEIDFLCIRHKQNKPDFWHVEVQVSFRPVGYIGGDKGAKNRSEEEIKDGIRQWVEKKFTGEKKKSKRDCIIPKVDWKYILVLAELREEREIPVLESMGIEVIRYKKILNDMISSQDYQSSSLSNNIIEILRYSKLHDSQNL